MKYLRLLPTVFFLSACVGFGNKATSNEEKVDRGLEQGLDILVDYDRESWPGPYSWNDQQWLWKERLNWKKDCDYIGEVDIYDIKPNQEFVIVTCVLGAYQAAQYLYLYNQEDDSSTQLQLRANDDNALKVWGDIEFDQESKLLTVFRKARGLADCGSYEVYDFNQLTSSGPRLIEWRKKECSEGKGDYTPPTKWPLQEL